MGAQHNSYVCNMTSETIKTLLTDTDKRNTTAIIEMGNCVCVPTPHGRNTLQVYKKDGAGYLATAVAAYTDDSDKSFLVKKIGNDFTITRSMQGNIYMPDDSWRKS
jgi:hypothetical protein